MRASLAGGQEELVFERVRSFLWSVTVTGIVCVTREPDLMRLMCIGSAICASPEWAGSDFGYRRPSRT
jgi:hypothetical protein